MCSIMVLIIWFFVVPGNMPLTAKICLEILFNCQLLCLLISILMLPEHIYGISQVGKRNTVTQCKAKALPGAPNWASLGTCCPLAIRNPTLPFWLKWASVEGAQFNLLVCFFCINFCESAPPCLCAVLGVMLKAIKWEEEQEASAEGGSYFWSLDSSQKAPPDFSFFCSFFFSIWQKKKKKFMEAMHVGQPFCKVIQQSWICRFTFIRSKILAAVNHTLSVCGTLCLAHCHLPI